MTRLCCASLVFAVAGFAVNATAQDWPTKPIKIIESFPAGVARDHRTRVIADKLSALLSHQVYVENRPGAAGRLAGQAAVGAAPDGYTFSMMGTTDILTKHLYRLSYDMERDLVPVSMIEKMPGAIIVRSSLAANSLQQLIRRATDHPGDLTYGSTGRGGWLHVSALLFSSITNTNLRHVPYAQGNLAPDLLGGHVDMVFDAIPPYLENIKAGNLKVLALAGERRASVLPDVPTFIESGVPAYDVHALYGLFAPTGTRDAIIAKIQEAIWRILQEPDLRRQWISEGGNPLGSGPTEFRAHIRSESERWDKILRANDIRLD
jgi:tripartite-type tricarboxylate transporter receptor subunit TctC